MNEKQYDWDLEQYPWNTLPRDAQEFLVTHAPDDPWIKKLAALDPEVMKAELYRMMSMLDEGPEGMIAILEAMKRKRKQEEAKIVETDH